LNYSKFSTEKEITQLLGIAWHPRDKAFLAVLYESGCRIGEILSLSIKDVDFDSQGARISIIGKTGMRKIRIISSVPYLITWLNHYPSKARDKPLWIMIHGKEQGSLMKYSTVRALLNRLMCKSEINKRCNPHLFRHSRATYLANYLTEFQMNQYFGWIQGSDMPSTYVHLSGKEIETAVLKLNGFKVSEETNESLLKPKVCACGNINAFENVTCEKCGDSLVKKEITKDMIMQFIMQDRDIVEMINKKIKEVS